MVDDEDSAAGRAELVAQIGAAAENKPEQTVMTGEPEPDGPPDRVETDFAHISHWGSRQAALKEYQRTLEEFRHTGGVKEKAWKDFAHFVHPRDLANRVLAAHRMALWDIEQWQEEQEEARRRREAQEARARLAQPLRGIDEGLRDADEEDDEPIDGDESEPGTHTELGASFADALYDAKDRLEALKNPAARAEPSLPVVRAPEVSKMAGLLRGISFDPDVPGRDARFEPAIPQLDVTPQPEQLPASDDQTEGLLNAMIGECHFLM